MKARVLVAVLVLAAGACAGAGLARLMDTSSPEAAAVVVPPAELMALQDSFVATADHAMKSVVHITTKTRSMEDFPFVVPEGKNVGSGVIMSGKGHILTNHHVVRGARELRVLFVDGREFDAKIIGIDQESDLALLKIDPSAGMKLHPVAFADSDKARVGEWVLAIGSPFGYNHTVTVGVVSGKHRRARLDLPYQDFIQTDASINPGNSGGALVNIRGELVGINTAIVSQSRRNEGVGFAISSNLVKWVYERLARDGRVRRGFLGVRPHDLNDDLVRAFRSSDIRTLDDLLEDLGMTEAGGVFLLYVERGTPAHGAGLKRGDVIVEFNGRGIRNQSELFFRVAEVEPGEEVEIRFLRNGKRRTVKVELAERPR